ncbi:MAG: hypothetical protein IJV12_07285, partial [Acidaminococcaceae bacterium]|nr:hypothetical protein [Acidaminococcaceae bacterium]
AYQAIVEKYEHPDFAWTKDQLLYAVRNAIVNKESGVSAETQSKVANVQGKNVTLVAQGIGLNTNQTTEIKASELGGGSEASIAKMKLLSNADATDVTMKDGNGNTLLFTVQDGKQVVKAYDAKGKEVATDGVIDTFVIGNLSPLGVYATGKVDVTAISDNVFIAGRSNDKAGFAPVNVGKITAGGSDGSGNVNSDVRLYTQEGIYNAADQLGQNEGNIHAKDLVAYGGTKDIGTKEKPVTVSLTGDLLTANADGNVYIKNIKGDKLRVGSVYAGDTVSLDSAKGFAMTTNPDYTLAFLNAGKVLELKTNPTDGVIGDAANPIRILNNAGTPENYGGELTNNGMLINLAGKDAYVKGVNGTRGNATTMRLGLVEMAGDFVASSESYLEAGAVRLADAEHDGINGKVDATGNVNLEAAKDVIVNGPVDSASGDISVTAGNDARINHEVNAASGGIRITAKNEAKINNTVATGSNTGTIAISGVNGVTLNGLVSAGNLNLVEEAYAGGGQIMLMSEKGSVIQGEAGVLKAASVTTASGNAILLTNEGNTFRNYTANGVERDKTDEQGNVVTDDAGNAVKE